MPRIGWDGKMHVAGPPIPDLTITVIRVAEFGNISYATWLMKTFEGVFVKALRIYPTVYPTANGNNWACEYRDESQWQGLGPGWKNEWFLHHFELRREKAWCWLVNE